MTEESGEDRSGDLFDVVDAILIASLTANACCLLTAIVSVVVRRAGGSGDGSRSDGIKKTGDHFQKPGIPASSGKVGYEERSGRNVHLWHTSYSAVEVFLSLLCAIGGLAVMTSSTAWTYPFSVEVVTGALNLSRVVMAAALGRFLFSLVSLVLQLANPVRWNLDDCKPRDYHLLDNTMRRSTAGFRAVYVAASVVCLASTVAQHSNYLLSSIILFLEIEQIPLFDTAPFFRERPLSAHHSRTVQLAFGFVCLAFRFVLPSTLVGVAATSVQSVTVLSPFQLGVMCFSIVFYSLCSMFVLRLLRPRQLISRHCRLSNDDVETATTTKATTCSKREFDGECWRITNPAKCCKQSGAVAAAAPPRSCHRRQDRGCCRRSTGTLTNGKTMTITRRSSPHHSKLSKSLKFLVVNGHLLVVDNMRAALLRQAPSSD